MMQSAFKGAMTQRKSQLFKSAASQLVATQRAGFAGKDIKFGTDARALMLEGCDMLADAV